MSDDRPILHLIDPDPEVLMALFGALSDAGVQVSASTRTMDGLQYLRRVRPYVVLCYADMPDLTGSDLVRRIRREAPGTHVLLALPADDTARIEPIRFPEGVSLISRPYDTAEILDAIASCRAQPQRRSTSETRVRSAQASRRRQG